MTFKLCSLSFFLPTFYLFTERTEADVLSDPTDTRQIFVCKSEILYRLMVRRNMFGL